MSSFLVSWYCSFLKRRRLSWEIPVGESQEQIGRLGLHNGNTLMTQLDNWTLCRKYSSSHQNIKLLPSFGKVDFSIDQVGISNLNKSQVLEDRDVRIDWHWWWGTFGVWMYKIQKNTSFSTYVIPTWRTRPMYGMQGGVASASASLPTEQLIGISFKKKEPKADLTRAR